MRFSPQSAFFGIVLVGLPFAIAGGWAIFSASTPASVVSNSVGRGTLGPAPTTGVATEPVVAGYDMPSPSRSVARHGPAGRVRRLTATATVEVRVTASASPTAVHTSPSPATSAAPTVDPTTDAPEEHGSPSVPASTASATPLTPVLAPKQ
ncbi:hypothetical protein GCM10012284_15930 [Mangrovihabitans endophyticus]|uniref:Uncharacterized protein n=1 Tax=Mangrovihabitans endophyticus TaxID=1751298 RepID=A0A8J3BY88_9ACTN|nr:hypothetical protein GCM10012284_15930 [Mangrovihabitans endophyticus]